MDDERSRRGSEPFLGPSAVLILFVLILTWLWGSKTTSLWAFLIQTGGVLGTAAAALFAAQSARASRAGVEELRTGRAMEARPALSMEPVADFFGLRWESGRGLTHMRYSRSSNSAEERGRVALRLSNFGGGAALDLRISFRFEGASDPKGLPALEDEFKVPGWSAYPDGRDGKIKYLPTGSALLFQVDSSFHEAAVRTGAEGFEPHCGPGREREVIIPRELVHYAFLRTWELARTKEFARPSFEGVLIVDIEFDTPLEKGLEAEFRLAVETHWMPLVGNMTLRDLLDGTARPLEVSIELKPQRRAN